LNAGSGLFNRSRLFFLACRPYGRWSVIYRDEAQGFKTPGVAGAEETDCDHVRWVAIIRKPLH
jgi:hypothetical protein